VLVEALWPGAAPLPNVMCLSTAPDHKQSPVHSPNSHGTGSSRPRAIGARRSAADEMRPAASGQQKKPAGEAALSAIA
jgi:hypothetical protein